MYPLYTCRANKAHQYLREVPILSFFVNQDTNIATITPCTKLTAIFRPGLEGGTTSAIILFQGTLTFAVLFCLLLGVIKKLRF
jgi:hypothetical protein